MAYTDQLQAAVMPIDTSVSIDADRCRAFFSAAWWSGTRRDRQRQCHQHPLPAGATDSPGFSS